MQYAVLKRPKRWLNKGQGWYGSMEAWRRDKSLSSKIGSSHQGRKCSLWWTALLLSRRQSGWRSLAAEKGERCLAAALKLSCIKWTSLMMGCYTSFHSSLLWSSPLILYQHGSSISKWDWRNLSFEMMDHRWEKSADLGKDLLITFFVSDEISSPTFGQRIVLLLLGCWTAQWARAAWRAGMRLGCIDLPTPEPDPQTGHLTLLYAVLRWCNSCA